MATNSTTSIYRIKRTEATREALLDFNLNYPEYENLSLVGQNLTFRNNFQSTDLFVRPGVSITLESSTNTNVADKIYLQDSWADYRNFISLANGTLTLSRGSGSTQEKVEFLSARDSNDMLVFNSKDVLVFKDGSVTVKQVFDALSPNPVVTLNALTATGPTSSATLPTIPASPSIVDIKAVLVESENVVSFGPGTKLTVSGSSGIDRVYVKEGSEVYAVNMRGGIDEIYVRGKSTEYTPDLSTLGVLKLTRSVTLGANTYTESVSVGSSLMNNDLLVFADGAIRTNDAAVAFKANANTTLSSLSAWTTTKATPGLTAQIDLTNNANGNDYSKALNGAETSAGEAIAPRADVLVSFSAVKSINIAIGGTGFDAAHDKLLLTGRASGEADIVLPLNTSPTPGTDATIGSISHLSYSYNASTHVLTITPASSFTLAAADVENIVQAIKFQNTEAAPNAGIRTFAVSITNGSGTGAVSTSTLTVPSDVSAPVIVATPTLTLKDATGAATTADIGVNGKVVLTIYLGEAASGLIGLPANADTNNTIITIGGSAKSGAVWNKSGNNLTLTYTILSGDNGAISVDNTALKTALGAGIKDTAGNFAKINTSAWATGSFTAGTTTHVADTTAPTISGSTFSVDENTTTVTTLAATDSVTSSGLVWSLESGGTDNNLFNIDPDEDAGDTLTYSLTTGNLPTGLSLASGAISGTPTADFSGSVTITANDGNGHSVDKAIQITVVSKPKVSSIAVSDADTDSSMAEAGKQGATVSLNVTLTEEVTVGGTLNATNLSAVFKAGGTALTGIAFATPASSLVNGKTVLHFTGTLPAGDATTVELDSLTLSGGLTLTGKLSNQAMDTSHTSLGISDSYMLDNTAPSFTSTASATVPENTAITTAVYTARATDTGTVTYSLKANTGDYSDLTINSSTGAVTFKAVPDYETKSSYSFTVVATDAAGNSSSRQTSLTKRHLQSRWPSPTWMQRATTVRKLTLAVTNVDHGSHIQQCHRHGHCRKHRRWSSGLYRCCHRHRLRFPGYCQQRHLQPQSQHRRRFRFQHQQQHRRSHPYSQPQL